MRPSIALAKHRDTIRRVVEANRARNPRIFGSVVRGEDTDASDLDVLVDPISGTTLFDLGAIQFELEETLGVHVDLVTLQDIHPKFRAHVLGEAQPV
ncbi:MAG: nucleotidyltransferase [Betaproteobacteria bacterium]|nr:MAG: nucleotidyltransferase [Betaproteobacteria bacterium]